LEMVWCCWVTVGESESEVSFSVVLVFPHWSVRVHKQSIT
jgi:hypothetical protein